MNADQREQLAQKDANRFLLLLEDSQAKLRQTQEEVKRLRGVARNLVETVHLIPFVPKAYKQHLGDACQSVEQALSPSEAKDA